MLEIYAEYTGHLNQISHGRNWEKDQLCLWSFTGSPRIILKSKCTLPGQWGDLSHVVFIWGESTGWQGWGTQGGQGWKLAWKRVRGLDICPLPTHITDSNSTSTYSSLCCWWILCKTKAQVYSSLLQERTKPSSRAHKPQRCQSQHSGTERNRHARALGHCSQLAPSLSLTSLPLRLQGFEIQPSGPEVRRVL